MRALSLSKGVFTSTGDLFRGRFGGLRREIAALVKYLLLIHSDQELKTWDRDEKDGVLYLFHHSRPAFAPQFSQQFRSENPEPIVLNISNRRVDDLLHTVNPERHVFVAKICFLNHGAADYTVGVQEGSFVGPKSIVIYPECRRRARECDAERILAKVFGKEWVAKRVAFTRFAGSVSRIYVSCAFRKTSFAFGLVMPTGASQTVIRRSGKMSSTVASPPNKRDSGSIHLWSRNQLHPTHPK